MQEKRKIYPFVVIGFTILFSIIFGVSLGLALAFTRNIIIQEDFTQFNPALPTRLLDIHGDVITEFASEEKREIIAIEELPPHVVNALFTREDQIFYEHGGFSIKAILRAVVGKIIGRNLGGGSTITQQIAGTLYCDRRDISIKRKLEELWWAIQMERRYSKDEIAELYLNEVFFGDGTYGIEAASKYYFGHSAKELTPAEAAILVIQLSNPAGNNPFKHPDNARLRQVDVLNQMVDLGYLTRAEADESFDSYWQNFDYTRISSSAYYMRDDKAPWFSEYVRRILSDSLYGTLDYTKDGFTVHTTLNIAYQQIADKHMGAAIEFGNRTYQSNKAVRFADADRVYIPMTELLGMVFDIPELAIVESRLKVKSLGDYNSFVNPTMEIMSLVCGIDSLKTITSKVNVSKNTEEKKTTVEGAFVCLENETGYITALIGGSNFGVGNQFIRATQAYVQPGSSFKPLYYSAAIDSRKFTAVSQFIDAPVVFKKSEEDQPYIPTNYGGIWYGSIQLWEALARSLNIPSIKVLDAIGYDAAISRSAALLGITDPETIEKTFPRVYSLALGVCSVSPMQMCRAYAVFGNQGKEVEPIAIRSVEDRNGVVILDMEKDLRIEQKKKQNRIQVVSPQNAYIMTNILKESVRIGTLRSASGGGAKFKYKDENGKEYQMPVAGKTGTTQNWADTWAIAYSPYYTATAWMGFDTPGNSMGKNLSDAALAAPPVVNFMADVHRELPYKDFPKPQTGLVYATVCAVSGMIMTESCTDGAVRQYFLDGTQPTQYCSYHERENEAKMMGISRIQRSTIGATRPKIEEETEDILVLPDFILEIQEKNGKKNKKTDKKTKVTEDALFKDFFITEEEVPDTVDLLQDNLETELDGLTEQQEEFSAENLTENPFL